MDHTPKNNRQEDIKVREYNLEHQVLILKSMVMFLKPINPATTRQDHNNQRWVTFST